MSEFIAGLVSKRLARKRWTARTLAASRRVLKFEVATRTPKDELKRLTDLAEAEGRSLSGYVTLVALSETTRTVTHGCRRDRFGCVRRLRPDSTEYEMAADGVERKDRLAINFYHGRLLGGGLSTTESKQASKFIWQAAERPRAQGSIEWYTVDRGNEMRGTDRSQSTMFSYVSPEARIPADHPLRATREMTNRALARMDRKFRKLYSRTGRPSVAPEQLLRALLLQVLYSIRSERMLMEQLEYNLVFRWFVGLAIDDRTTTHAGYEISQRKRKFVEQIFGWGKTIGPIRKVKHRGVARVGWMFPFTQAAYNLVRMRPLLCPT